jgi:hypothetical protein
MEFENFWKKKDSQITKSKVGVEINKDFKPTRACIIDDTKEIDSQTKEILLSIEKNGVYVNYIKDNDFFEQGIMKNAGESTYAISECDEKNKFGEDYCNCTGFIIVGEDKDSKKQISSMSHQYPDEFLKSKKKEFIKDLVDTVEEIKRRTKEKSVDVVIFGGNAGGNQNKYNYDIYKKSIKLIGEAFKKELNFEPTVMTGPNKGSWRGSTKVYFDTQNRRLYILRPHQESELNESYLPSEIEEKSKKW